MTAEAEQASYILLNAIRMAVGTAHKTNDNGVQVTVVMPKNVWAKLEGLVEATKVDNAPEPSDSRQMKLL